MTRSSGEARLTLHQRLRAETRQHHETLETAVAVERQIETLERYTAYLSRLWLIHHALELQFARWDASALGFDYRDRSRARMLAADLAALGADQPRAAGPQVGAFKSAQHALGAIYVVEGSSLGARAILPSIEQSLGLDTTSGASFFEGFGAEGKPLWRACLAAIDAIDPHTAAADRVVAGAQATFDLYLDSLPERPLSVTNGLRDTPASAL